MNRDHRIMAWSQQIDGPNLNRLISNGYLHVNKVSTCKLTWIWEWNALTVSSIDVIWFYAQSGGIDVYRDKDQDQIEWKKGCIDFIYDLRVWQEANEGKFSTPGINVV